MSCVLGAQGNFGDAASYLVEKGADANDVYVDEGGDRHSLLMDAIIVENVPFAELLVKHGADVNVTDEQGVTTLIQVHTVGGTQERSPVLFNLRAPAEFYIL